MALWYLGVLLFSIFSGLYFTYNADRYVTSDKYRQNAAGLFIACHNAALAAAKSDTRMGNTTAVTYNCSGTSLGGSIANNLNVPDVQIRIEPTPGAQGRTVTTYLPANQTMSGLPFAEVLSQVQLNYSNSVSVGQVVADASSSTGFRIQAYTPIVVSIPAAVGAGALATTTRLPSRCPAGVALTGGKCFRYVGTAATETAAATACASTNGGHLAMIKGGSDLAAIRGLVPAGTMAWLDGIRVGSTNTFRFSDSTDITYTPAWNAGEPNNAGGSENCVELWTNSNINDQGCNTVRPGYVCEY